MGIFSIFRKNPKPPVKQIPEAPAPEQATPKPDSQPAPVKEAASPVPAQVSWSIWGKEVVDVRLELAKEFGLAQKRGLRMLVYSYEPWSPGSVGFKKFGQHPLGLALMRNVHVVEVNLNHMDALQRIGMSGGGIPQLWAMEADGSYAGKTVSGGIWGADIPENIDGALGTWFTNLGWR